MILQEKHVILLTNQYLLLFSFVFPNDLLDSLDSTTPNIMEVPSIKIDFASVKEMYHNDVINDLNISLINYPQKRKLPENEEFKLR